MVHKIRSMTEKDLDQVVMIEKEIFTQPWSRKGFKDALDSEYTEYLVSEDETGRITGYCGYLRSFEIADITNMAVTQSARGQGIGRRLLQALMKSGMDKGIERYTLEVRAGNVPAIRLYEGLGYKVEGVRKKFYALPTEDALIMWT